MNFPPLLYLFADFGLVAACGFQIGMEREMRGETGVTLGIRGFMFFALLGAISSFTAVQYENMWIIVAGFVGVLALVISAYWADRNHGPGVTTEFAALFIFFGVLIVNEAEELTITLAIVALGILFPKVPIKRFRIQCSQ